MSPAIGHLVLSFIVALSILLMLLRPRNVPEVWWVGSGAALLVVLRLVPLAMAGRAVAKGSDVSLFLIGMMLLSSLAENNGVFEWLSSSAVRRANGSSVQLFTLLYGIGTVVTVCMSNDATAVVLTPAVLSAVRKAKVEPLPHLFACAMIANAASFVLPISNPANLVVFSAGMPSLGRWLSSFLPASLLSIATTYLILRLYFRKQLVTAVQGELAPATLPRGGRLVLWGLGHVVAVLLTASALKLDLGLPTCLAALLITGVVCVREKRNPLRLVREISWSTLLLVAGLFIMVDAVEGLGTLRYTQQFLTRAQHLPAGAGALVVSFVVGVLNNVVNNLPLGLIAGATVRAAHLSGLLTNALLIGVDLGPNLSVTGSLATILWLLALRKEKLDVSAWDFLKVGLIAMPAAMLAAVGGLLAMRLFTSQ